MDLVDDLGGLLDQILALFLLQVDLLDLCLGGLLSFAGCATPVTVRRARGLDAVKLGPVEVCEK